MMPCQHSYRSPYLGGKKGNKLRGTVTKLPAFEKHFGAASSPHGNKMTAALPEAEQLRLNQWTDEHIP